MFTVSLFGLLLPVFAPTEMPSDARLAAGGHLWHSAGETFLGYHKPATLQVLSPIWLPNMAA